MSTPVNIQAGGRLEINELGRFFRLLSTEAPVTITYYRQGKEIARADLITEGWSETFMGDGYDRFVIASATAQTLQFVSRLESTVQYDRTPTGDVQVTNAAPIAVSGLVTDSGAPVGSAAAGDEWGVVADSGIHVVNVGNVSNQAWAMGLYNDSNTPRLFRSLEVIADGALFAPRIIMFKATALKGGSPGVTTLNRFNLRTGAPQTPAPAQVSPFFGSFASNSMSWLFDGFVEAGSLRVYGSVPAGERMSYSNEARTIYLPARGGVMLTGFHNLASTAALRMCAEYQEDI